jgi:hypothetical protein
MQVQMLDIITTLPNVPQLRAILTQFLTLPSQTKLSIVYVLFKEVICVELFGF